MQKLTDRFIVCLRKQINPFLQLFLDAKKKPTNNEMTTTNEPLHINLAWKIHNFEFAVRKHTKYWMHTRHDSISILMEKININNINWKEKVNQVDPISNLNVSHEWSRYLRCRQHFPYTKSDMRQAQIHAVHVCNMRMERMCASLSQLIFCC